MYAYIFQKLSFHKVPPLRPCMHLPPTSQCPAYYPILLYLFSRIIFAEEYVSWISCLCSVFQSPYDLVAIESFNIIRMGIRLRRLKRTNLLTPWCRVLPEKLTGLQLVKKFPAFYGTRRFITALKNLCSCQTYSWRTYRVSHSLPNPAFL